MSVYPSIDYEPLPLPTGHRSEIKQSANTQFHKHFCKKRNLKPKKVMCERGELAPDREWEFFLEATCDWLRCVSASVCLY